MKTRTIACALMALAGSLANADTNQTGPHTYEVDAGVSFTMSNLGSSSFLFEWIDKSGFFTNVEDPTLVLTAGETYTFENMTSIHPFNITDDTLPVDGTDGSFFRLTTDINVINNASLQPMADFISNPGGGDLITWTPTTDDVGTYYYTCRIVHHIDMTGKLVVVAPAASCPADLTGDGELNFFDVSAFLSAFAASDPIADFNGDGSFNFFDVSAFLASFAAGCP